MPFAWRITRAADGTLYLILARNNDGRFGEPGGGDLYKSSDGAEHWAKMRLPDGCQRTQWPHRGSARQPPPISRRLGTGPRPGSIPAAESFSRLTRARRGGRSSSESQHIYDVTIDPLQPGTSTLAVSPPPLTARSTPDGTWTRIRGYNFKWGHRVIPDANDRKSIYITTYGGSVWHGPAAGDPDAIEDILTPVPVAR